VQCFRSLEANLEAWHQMLYLPHPETELLATLVLLWRRAPRRHMLMALARHAFGAAILAMTGLPGSS
jgi:hypothetical protein